MLHLLYLNKDMSRFLFQNALTVILPLKLKQSAGKWRVLCNISGLFASSWRDSPQWARASSLTKFLDHTQRRITVGRTPLDEWSVRCRYLYLTTHSNHNRQTSMPPVEFEPTISAGERPQTYALDRAATGTGKDLKVLSRNTNKMQLCNRIYYSKVYWRLNMYRAAHRSSSGALNCICSLSFTYPCGDRPVTTWVYKPEAANTI